jgi:hypothetical protein
LTMIFDDSLHRNKKIQQNFLQLQKQLSLSEYPSIDKYGFVHATPIIVGREDNSQYKEFYETLMNVVRRIIVNYRGDGDVKKIIHLPEKFQQLLGFCSEDYNLGTLRPDFLIDGRMNFKMCEINGRFPLNGYFITYLMNQSFRRVKEFRKLEPLEENDMIPEYFERIFGNTSVLKIAEPNWDIALYGEYLEKKGKKLEIVHPKNKDLKNLESVIVELRQPEILEHLLVEQVRELQNHPHLNDLRTILIGHDKRLLAVLYDKKLLGRYATSSERKIIEPHLIETYFTNYEIPGFAANKDEWVLKHALLGKSKHVYIGKEMSMDEWVRACLHVKKEPFIIQKKVKEHRFSIYLPHLGEIKNPIYGTLLGVDGKFISQGLLRTIYEDKTRFSSGFMSLLPVLRK